MGSKYIADGIYQVGASVTQLKNGKWSDEEPDLSYLIESEAKLSGITGAEPGAFAHTAGFKKIWELDTDGTTWVPIV